MGEIPMPGGWMLSLFWVPMCGQTWAAAAASFVAMWAVMMVAMMLPSVLPMLWRLGLAPGALAGAGYFLVWTVLGLAVFTVCTALAETVMQTPALGRAVPISMGLVVLLAGAFQFTAWKARHLANCRPAAASDLTVSRRTGTAWRYGVWLGLQCIRACAGLTAILLVIGVMDLRAMAVVAAVITAERLAPAGQRVAWAVGAVSIVAGVYLMARGVWFA